MALKIVNDYWDVCYNNGIDVPSELKDGGYPLVCKIWRIYNLSDVIDDKAETFHDNLKALVSNYSDKMGHHPSGEQIVQLVATNFQHKAVKYLSGLVETGIFTVFDAGHIHMYHTTVDRLLGHTPPLKNKAKAKNVFV